MRFVYVETLKGPMPQLWPDNYPKAESYPTPLQSVEVPDNHGMTLELLRQLYPFKGEHNA